MKNGRLIPEAVHWHEGMLLTPQHFQQFAGRLEALLGYGAASTVPFPWGVQEIEYDETLLSAGKLRIRKLEAVLPDGLLLLHEPSWPDAPELDLAPRKQELAAQPLTVYVGAPELGSGAAVGDGARFRSIEGDPTADQATGEAAVRIPRLRPRARLLAEAAAGYCSMPLTRIRFAGEAFVQEDFIPPVLALEAPCASSLRAACSKAVRGVREKASLASQRAGASAGSGPVALRLTLHALAAELPALEAVLHTGRASPFAAYLGLCRLAGSLTALGRRLTPPAFSGYDHTDLAKCFAPLLRYVHEMLREGVPEFYTPYRFEKVESGFRIDFEASWVGKRLILEAQRRQDASEEATARWMEQALIGSLSIIQSLRERRVRGAERRRVASDEELAPAPGSALFQLEPDAQTVHPGQALRVEGLAGDSMPLELTLYVRTEAS